MKMVNYPDVTPTHFDRGPATGVAARVVIGKQTGAENFWMRVFEIAPGGNTPEHAHDWEHEMFIHAGRGEILGNGRWNPVEPGKVIFIPANEPYQIKNTGPEPLTIVCLVPGSAPEL